MFERGSLLVKDGKVTEYVDGRSEVILLEPNMFQYTKNDLSMSINAKFIGKIQSKSCFH